MEKYNIICLSNQMWDFPNHTNKRLVMERLARLGHTVLFVDPPLNLGRLLARQILAGQWSLSRICTLTKQDPSGAVIVTPVNFDPTMIVSSKLICKYINYKAKKLFDPTKKTLLWVYNVQLVNLNYYLANLNRTLLIYDCVDNYEGFPHKGGLFSTVVSKQVLKHQEPLLAKAAQLVFATTPGLVTKLKAHNPNTFFTPNVGDYERFKDAKKFRETLPDDLKAIPRPRIGYIGAFDSYKFDFKLLKKCALDYPSYSFVLIGQLGLKDRKTSLTELGLADLPNIYFLGPKPYDQKARYLAGFDVDIIPYVLNDYTVEGCFPVKFHDSLSAGQPVVVTDMPGYYPFKDVCYISKTDQDFSDNIKRALDEDTLDRQRARKAVAKENNWDAKVESMLKLIGTIGIIA